MTSITSKPFRSGNSQALRLPKEFAFPDESEVVITKVGDSLRVDPKPRLTPAQLVEALRALPKPSSVQKRLPITVPERQGN